MNPELDAKYAHFYPRWEPGEVPAETCEYRAFPTDVVASLASGFLLCDFSDIHELIEYLCGGPVWTHQIPRVTEPTQYHLARLHPSLAAHDLSRVTRENYEEQRHELLRKFPGPVPVYPMPGGMVEARDPIVEAEQMMGKDRVIPVTVRKPERN